VKLQVTTDYFGAEADRQRSKFANSTLKEIEKSYLNFYANQFPDIEVARDLAFLDDERENKFTTLEEYTIAEIWTREEKGGDSLLTTSFYPQIIRDRLLLPSTLLRKMPIALYYPGEIEEAISVYLPESWPTQPYTKTIRDNSFFFQSEISFKESNKCLSLVYKYRNLRDHVPVKEAGAYIKKQKAIINDLGYQLTRNLSVSNKPFALNWLMVMIAIATLGAAGFGAYKLYAYDPPALVIPRVKPGIEGWLVLVMLGLLFSPLRYALHIYSESYFNVAVWQVLTNAASVSYRPALAGMLVVEMVVNTLFMVYSILLLVLFFQKRTALPRLLIIYYTLNLLFLVVDTAIAEYFGFPTNSQTYGAVFGSFLTATIWIPYFIKSNRVKRTFVNQLKPADSLPVNVPEQPADEEMVTA
jgi:hypothetical protein